MYILLETMPLNEFKDIYMEGVCRYTNFPDVWRATATAPIALKTDCKNTKSGYYGVLHLSRIDPNLNNSTFMAKENKVTTNNHKKEYE